MPEQWAPDERVFDRVNRCGTANVLDSALRGGVRRVVYTSTMDVFFAPPGGTVVETAIDPSPKASAYERSKQAAEVEAEKRRAAGLDVVFVNPAAVYGPSPVHVGLNSLVIRVLSGRVPMLPPGGLSVAYVDGVADAHVAAAESGRSGERYLLADTFVTTRDLARHVAREGGLRRIPPTVPTAVARGFAALLAPLARRLDFTPMLAPGQLSFLLWRASADSSKAIRELGFTPTQLREGVRQTVAFLRREGLVPQSG
jgi:nucleoside-diphosphate-sugar epimerase